MSIQVRRDDDVHAEQGGWFSARWHFSFGGYRDPRWMGVGPLRVFNDDRLVPGATWPMHPHRDIESCTYVVSGAFGHADSLGNGGTLAPGAAQVMRFSHAGAQHSESNDSDTEPMRFLQFWLLPSTEGLRDEVQQADHDATERADTLLQIMGPAGEDGLDLASDARVLVSSLSLEAHLDHRVTADRSAYLYVIDGDLGVGDERLVTGDAAVVTGPEDLALVAHGATELIVVDVPTHSEPVGVWAGRP